MFRSPEMKFHACKNIANACRACNAVGRTFGNQSETNYSFHSAYLEEILGAFKIKGRPRERGRDEPFS